MFRTFRKAVLHALAKVTSLPSPRRALFWKHSVREWPHLFTGECLSLSHCAAYLGRLGSWKVTWLVDMHEVLGLP